MTLFLGSLDRAFDATFLVISSSHEASGWILKELCFRHLYPTCFPVVLDDVAAPDSWPTDAPLFQFPDFDHFAAIDVLPKS